MVERLAVAEEAAGSIPVGHPPSLSFPHQRFSRKVGVSYIPPQSLPAPLPHPGVRGLRKRYAPIRYFAMTLFVVTIVKVFAIDLAQLDRIYRVGSVIGLGVMLLLTSFLYQRLLKSGSDAGRGTPGHPVRPPDQEAQE